MIKKDENNFWTKDRFTLPSTRGLRNRLKVRQRKRLYRKMYKKPSAFRYIARGLIISVLIIAVVFSCLVFIRYMRFSEYVSVYNLLESNDIIQKIYNKVYEEKDTERSRLIEELNGGPLTDKQKDTQYEIRLKSYFNSCYYTDPGEYSVKYKIFNDDMTEEVAGLDCNELVLVFSNASEIDNNKYMELLYYECADEDISRQLDIIRDEILKTGKNVAFRPTIKGAYIKDDYSFIPVDLDLEIITKYKKKQSDIVYEYTYDHEKFNNSNLSKEELEALGYRYIDIDSNANINLLFTMDNETKTMFDKYLNNEPYSSFNNIVYDSWDIVDVTTKEDEIRYNVISIGNCDFLDSYAYAYDIEYLSRYDIVYYHYTNFDILKKELIFVMTITFLLAFIVLYGRYNRQKNQYEMNIYRRELTNVMAHDIKTPLMAIRGNAENLQDIHRFENRKETTESEDEEIRFIDGIVRNVDYVDSLVNKTLSLSSLESGYEMLKKENISIKDIINKVINKNSEQFEKRKIKVEVTGEDIAVPADEFWVNEAFDNLFCNAAKYADEDSTVTVELVKKGLRVINSFGGTTSTDASMDAKKLSDPFYKSDKSRSGRKGSGIGLSIVKNIIEMHGWRFKTKVKDGVFVAEIQM